MTTHPLLLTAIADYAISERRRTGLAPHWTCNIVAANGSYLVAVGWSSQLVVREEGISLDETAHRALSAFREYVALATALERTKAAVAGSVAANE